MKTIRGINRAAAMAGFLAVALAACVDIDGDLAASGVLEFRYTYDPPPHATFKSERARLGSAHVRVTALERDRTLWDQPSKEFITAALVVDDPRRLSSAQAFADMEVDVDLAAGRLRLDLPEFPPDVRERIASSEDEGVDRPALRLRLRLPGRVMSAEPAALVED